MTLPPLLLLAIASWLPWLLLSSAQVAIPLSLTRSPRRPPEDAPSSLGEWAHAAGLHLLTKYGRVSSSDPQKRASTIGLQDSLGDASYSASLTIGTPPQLFQMIVDTGSADLWIASSACSPATGCPVSVAPFVQSASSTFKPTPDPFNITYGSGSAFGTLSTDNVSLGTDSVIGATVAVCSEVDGIFKQGAGISGLMGMAWQPLARSGALPVWQMLAQSKLWDAPEFAFALRRWSNVAGAPAIEEGGYLTLGGVEDSLFTGEINYVPLSTTPSYWEITLEALTVNNMPVAIGQPNVAIDTGTSLIGAPSAVFQTVFSAIPGANEVQSGPFRGYWTIPCEDESSIAFQFGGSLYPMNQADFRLGSVPTNEGGGCLTSFFSIDQTVASGKDIPDWIIGVAFLKNVYVVFRAVPPSVGFAPLSNSFKALSLSAVQASLNSSPLPPSSNSQTDNNDDNINNTPIVSTNKRNSSITSNQTISTHTPNSPSNQLSSHSVAAAVVPGLLLQIFAYFVVTFLNVFSHF